MRQALIHISRQQLHRRHARRLACEAGIYPVVLDSTGAVLDLGRTQRVANRDQRHALRSLYTTCAIPGCNVHYQRCKLHHVIWWRHGGRTDLDNLLPVCAQHHTRLHTEMWELTLGPNRQLTIRLPDGNILTTGPPTRHAA